MAFEPFMQLLRGIQGRRTQGIGGIQNSHQMAYLRHLQKEINQENPMSVSLQELNVVVFDIETTGFYPDKGDSILSIGGIKMQGPTILANQQFYSLIYDDKKIPSDIIDLTGITNEQINSAPKVTDVFVDFFQFTKDSILVAHHASHEKMFMQYVCSKVLKIPFKQRIVDTSFLYRIAEPKLQNATLELLCEKNNIPIIDRHHALGDAKMTAELWGIYMNKAIQNGCETLNDVYAKYASI